MKREDLEERTCAYFDSGFCCSESVSKIIVELFSEHPEDYPVNVSSAFIKGIGKTSEEACGALSGGIIAIGYLHGRTAPGENIDKACQLAGEFRNEFISAFGSTQCRAILDIFGEQVNSEKCRRLIGQTAGILADILAKE